MSLIETYKRALEREKKARKLAEQIIEEKSLELYSINTELKRINKSVEAEVKLRATEMQDLFDNMYDGYVRLDHNGKLIKSNKAARKILGYPVDKEIEGLSLKDIVYEEDREKSKKYMEKLLSQGFYSNYVGRIYDREKNIKYVEVNSNAVYNDQKEVIGSRDIIRDVTKRKVAEEKLQESQKQLQAVFDNKSIGIALFNKNGAFISINDSFKRQLGYDDDFYSATIASRIIHEDDVEQYEEYVRSIYIGEIQEVQVENRYRKKSGHFFWANSNISGIYDEKNILVYFVLLVEDITAKKIAEEQLKLQEEKYRNIIDNMNLGLLEVNLQDEIQYANQGFLQMSGYSFEELENKEARKLFLDPENQNILNQQALKRNKGETDAYELKVITKSGERKWWLISGAPRFNDQREQVGSVGIHLDITEQKHTQKKLKSSLQELELANKGLKDFAHVVSHDLKSPLRSISGLVQILQEDYTNGFDEDGHQIVEDIINRTEHMDELISGILSYSSVQRNDEKLVEFDSKEIVDKVLNFIEIPDNMELSISGIFPKLRMNPTYFQQVVQNILTNAVKYNDKDKGIIRISAKTEANQHVFVIQDNGQGIDSKHQEKIFEMFQKFDTEGKSSTGIGLAVVKKIIDLYQGGIRLESSKGVGATFTFWLPV